MCSSVVFRVLLLGLGFLEVVMSVGLRARGLDIGGAMSISSQAWGLDVLLAKTNVPINLQASAFNVESVILFHGLLSSLAILILDECEAKRKKQFNF